MDKKIKKFIGIVLALLAIGLNYSTPVRTFASLPEQIVIREGQLRELDFGLPVSYTIINEKSEQNVEDDSVTADTGRSVLGGATTANITSNYYHKGSSYINVSAFGIFPIKKIQIITMRDREIIPCGHSIGVMLNVKGVLIVGFCDVLDNDGAMYSPARNAGLNAGDFVLEVDGTKIRNASHLASIINHSDGSTMAFTVQRNNIKKIIEVKPIKDKQDNLYHVGIWGRDSSSGIGTLTYIDPANGKFGALGHPISDGDTGKILQVDHGDIFRSRVVQIHKGLAGQPGEFKGQFSGSIDRLGRIERNCLYGLFGVIDKNERMDMSYKAKKVAANHEIVKGPAKILTTIDSKGVQEFDCEIIKINYDENTTKNMVIRITDEVLLEKTGGIVQGMSGSPLIQNDKIIGAVTHVFVNDPSTGHAVFINSMLQNGH